MDPPFANRTAAGQLLAEAVAALRLELPVVLALPRGGVPVALEVARRLSAPLDLLIVRKIGAPWQPELAVAAVVDAAPPELVLDDITMAQVGVSRDYVESQVQRQLAEIERRRALYLKDRRREPLSGRSVIVVDDGVATGTTMRAALRAVRRAVPARLVVAVPVAAPSTADELAREADDLVCLSRPGGFRAVGLHYLDFHQVEDDEVIALLQQMQ
ncbi:phosphoribosyltransferase [Caldimonas brevitalea]|uniref:Phosphoribosyltransferase n=1 Tax=Caldimonas brevitalea TaxID=413882 RepID=A0A0G3BIS6_9BURK|nr:phosphoribosyltransferase family protein [Caldimonas brevitalea]AKJ29339.1 phosphoribosyltransferase [Caldimonas brevitalea]